MSTTTNTIIQLNDELNRELAWVRKRRGFNAKEWIDKKTDLFNEYMTRSGLKACVVNLSGGVDSACTLGLMLHASKKAGSPIKRVVGIAQPIHSTAAIWKRALECGQQMGAEVITVDQSDLHTQLCQKVEEAIQIPGQDFARGQLRSYMRTPVGFFVAQLISQSGNPCIVVGTGNLDEDGYLFYFCKAGDGVADVQLIADLHKSEVFAVSKELNVPTSILVAPPSADLWAGQTDENELGFTYDFIELYTEYLRFDEKTKQEMMARLSEDSVKMFHDLAGKADVIHRRNKHKAHFPLNINVLLDAENL
jgi:NAD+ synthase (glutamine-hydrolysing)